MEWEGEEWGVSAEGRQNNSIMTALKVMGCEGVKCEGVKCEGGEVRVWDVRVSGDCEGVKVVGVGRV